MTKILAFCEDKIPSAILGINNIFQYMEKKININFYFKKTHEIRSLDIINSDIIICVRGASDLDRDVVRLSHLKNKFIIYYLDDDLMNIPDYSICSDFYKNKFIQRNMENIMKMSDVLWTPNINIKNKYKIFFKRNYVIDIPIHLEYIKKFENNKRPVKICFAGSIDHVYVIDYIISPVINYLLEVYGNDIYLYMIGVKPKKIKKYSNLEIIEYFNDIDEYYSFIRKENMDIGIAPLLDTDFNSCKYYNKFLDYSINGMIGVYSNVEPYKFIIKNMENGILVENNVKSWESGLNKLINSYDLRKKIYLNSLNILEENFSYDKIMSIILKLIPEIHSFKSKNTKNKNDIFLELKINLYNNFFINRIINGFRTFGFKYLFIGSCKVPKKILNYINRGKI